jgi:2,3-bisphosphoglycerate-dependent phosphoglycerate mutase
VFKFKENHYYYYEHYCNYPPHSFIKNRGYKKLFIGRCCLKVMKKEFKIYVFRHGQTDFNRDSKFTGFVDAKITKTGLEDAQIVAERLKKKKFAVAFHTSLSRSKDTLNVVLKSHPECKRFLCDDRMVERNYGDLNTKTHLQVVKKFGFEKYDDWHRSWNVRPPKGECFADVEKRVKLFIKDLKEFIKQEKVNVAISAHGNSIRLFRKIMEGLSIKETCELYVPYDKVFEYELKV